MSLPLPLSLFSVHFAACAQTCLLSACLAASTNRHQSPITTRLNSLRQWRLIWRGGPGLSLPDSVPNTITPLFRYPAVFYNFAIFQCQGQAFWRVFIEFPAGPCCRVLFFSFLFFCAQPSPSPGSLCASSSCFKTVKKKIRASFHQILETVFHCYHHECNKLKTQRAENPLHIYY